MKHEFWAEFDLYTASFKSKAQKVINDFVKHNTLNEPWNQITDHAAFQHLLAQLLPTKDKNNARRWLLKWYQSAQDNFNQFLKDRLYESQSVSVLEIFQWQLVEFINGNDKKIIAPHLSDISLFPPGTWAIQIHFTLRKPYLSKDDVDFYIVDNPVKKEWVFKVPYVAPSQWKGALRAAMLQQLEENLRSKKVDEEGFTFERSRLYRLFGNEKDGTAEFLNRALTLHRVGPRPADEKQAQKWEERYKQTFKQVVHEFEEKVRAEGYRKENVEGFQGRLHFYPTFFDRIGLEVINPHPRDTGAGDRPIYFECVPADAKGVFTLLYVPLDAGPKDTDTVKTDLHAVACGVCAMLTQYGFGAKTSSGYGVVESEVQIKGEPEKQRKEFERIWKENCSTNGGKQDE